MLSTSVIFIGLFVFATSVAAADNETDRVVIDPALQRFLGTLEHYANTANDVVFLLDDSGSIEAARFPQVKLFTKLIAQRLSVSSDHSRVAVVTFSTDTNTYADYIQNPFGNNMCTLLKEIDKVEYTAGWTHTDKAMVEADKILAHGRPGSNKIIVLLTDGDSNAGHSPVPMANTLKQKNVIIFAIGVAEVNVKEINDVATSPDHIYILKDFDYIKKVNKYLVDDTREISMVLAKERSYCNSYCTANADCCDVNADCYCGTRTGRYECACHAGFQGSSGYKGECSKCPRGTYKSESRNADCTACPPHSTTDKEGSTSFTDCQCETGYEKIGKDCVPVRCATLSTPVGGILIPSHCNNTYGTQCSFKCKEGYCPFSCSALDFLNSAQQHAPIPKRTCLETRRWSGEEFHCEKRTCPALHFPINGNHNCSEKDFTFGTTCSFKCDKGFELHGSHSRTCLFNSWTGDEVTCKGIFCDPLKTNSRLHVKRTACGTKPMPYRSVCQYHCADGYVLVRSGNKSDGVLTCDHNKKWSGGYNDLSCKDIEPPKIKCPKSTEVDAEFHKGYGHVGWEAPNATDNVREAFVRIRILEPELLKKSPFYKKGRPSYYFSIGRTKVVYEATDFSNLSSTCSFTVQVLDKEPPKVVSCPSDIEIYHNANDAIPVTWEEPIFEDNSKRLKSLKGSRKSGDKFAWGPATPVYYNATDEANNTASCTFQVKVKHYPCPYYPPPANGVLTCDNWLDGRLCSIFCHDGFQFAAKNYPRNYMCKQVVRKDDKIEGRWEAFRGAKNFKMPWPDCTRKQNPVALNVTVEFNYAVDSCSEESLKKFREKFFRIDAFKLDFFCPKDKGDCSPDNINITCSPISARIRRSYRMDSLNNKEFASRRYREIPKQMLTITFNVQVFPNATKDGSLLKPTNAPDEENEIDLASSPLMKSLENKISMNVKDAYNVSTLSEPEVNYGVILMCSVGQISVNSSCVNCPSGTYKDDISETCIDCPSATYQGEEGQLTCKACPIGFTTHEVKSKSKDDCKGPCQPGTYSQTTFEPCLACPLNTHQERAARKECMKCSSGLFTWRVGANSSQDCVAPCKEGTFSDTGYEPCTMCEVGTFQENQGQTNCTICPERMTTPHKGAKHFEDCKEFDICKDLHPCEHDSTCIQRDKEYECQCPEGLMGKNCEINVDDCVSSPCLNNGTCVDDIGNFTCLCSEGWTGHQCQTNIDDCDPNPCSNFAECFDLLNAYECICLPGFSGDRCEINNYECEFHPCLNNGTCFDMQNGYRCCCPKDFYGPNCEHELVTSVCDTIDCKNGGSCATIDESFKCLCEPGFDGEFCEINIDDCVNIKCENDGVCVDGIENATCDCPKKYTGLHCEEALMPEYALTFTAPSTSNYVELNNVHRLYAVTMSFFMKTSFKDPNSRATPVSYSFKYQDQVFDNALTLLDTNSFVLYILGHTFHTELSANSDANWHHYAVTWEKLGGKWAFYVDGKSIISGKNVGEDKFLHPGTFVLGQEQDDVGSMFSALEAFAGDITEFNVWDYAMTPDEILKISSSCGYIGNVIPWYTVSQYISGDVKVSQKVDKCEVLGHCSENSCDCFYSSQAEEHSCKNNVNFCFDDSCDYNQPCVTIGDRSFCKCDVGFEGRRCEYDKDECLDQNGGCDYVCVNDVGTGSYHCECPADMILSEDGKTCKDTGYCLKDGKTYLNGEAWLNHCQNCFCDRGIVTCEDVICNETICHDEETLLISPGECCPKCVAWSFCVISPDSSIMSFDLSTYKVDGGCTYTAVEDCIGGRFKVQIENARNLTSLVIYQDCSKMTMFLDGSVAIDNYVIQLPFSDELWNIVEVNSSVTIKTNADFVVEWNPANEAVIAVPITHTSKLCGLCSRIEDYYASRTGIYPLLDRWASGENGCFVFSEDYQEFSSGGLSTFLSARWLYVCLLIITITKAYCLT